MQQVSKYLVLISQYAIKKSMVYGGILYAILFLSISLYAQGDEEQDTSVDAVKIIENDPFFNSLFEKTIKTKPSLEYLLQISKANNALKQKDYFTSLDAYTTLFEIYGALPEIVFGIGENYFWLGDQQNALKFYNMAIDEQDDMSPNGFSNIEVTAHYRKAHIAFQENTLQEYVKELQYITSISNVSDDALIPLLEMETIDDIMYLFRFELDFSFIAHRELGVYYLSIHDGITEINPQALESLLIALSMATHTISNYLKTQFIGYEFTDLSYMIELLNRENSETNYINTFHIARMISMLWRYYTIYPNSHNKFMRAYCEALLTQMRVFDYDTPNDLQLYTPVLY